MFEWTAWLAWYLWPLIPCPHLLLELPGRGQRKRKLFPSTQSNNGKEEENAIGERAPTARQRINQQIATWGIPRGEGGGKESATLTCPISWVRKPKLRKLKLCSYRNRGGSRWLNFAWLAKNKDVHGYTTGKIDYARVSKMPCCLILNTVW